MDARYRKGEYEYCVSTYTGSEHKEDVLLQWQTTPPNEPGWYWVRRTNGEFECVHPVISNETMTIHGWKGDDDFTHWLGPLPEPEMPE